MISSTMRCRMRSCEIRLVTSEIYSMTSGLSTYTINLAMRSEMGVSSKLCSATMLVKCCEFGAVDDM